MRVEEDAILTCSTCGVEGEHELLYLSDHLRASRCRSCGATGVYSPHIYADYARDVAERTARLPMRLAGEAIRRPTHLLLWPWKALRKPFGLLDEVGRVYTFDRDRRCRTRAAVRRVRSS
ncbi:hypothetical protein E0L93_05225 [Rubrobacter taiwanensis]|uniref:Bh protein n=1 Tax=Rubrobacter taiwanensis TaxID=185139 RepID=A0A4R1BN24_9ACTN|nr:hypothetical protein [Rubrobacter taiwanensis]TCJ18903.1 hypothetical protein E0L93_05225 [Rubrobacter taiwanensis]